MKNTFLVNGISFQVSAKLVECGVLFPNENKVQMGRTMYHNQFKITVQTDKGRRSFNFYGSQQDWSDGVKELDKSALKGALECFISDACAGDQDFENFCDEMGYDHDSRKAEKIHAACVKSLDKFNFLTDNADVYDTVNAINELETV